MSIKTVSLETSKLLKEAGFRQDGEFQWLDYAGKGPHLNPFTKMCHRENVEKCYEVICSAPTTDELLEELPKNINKSGNTYYLYISFGKYFSPFYWDLNDGTYLNHPLIEIESLPEALAALWIWLKKENLICQ